MRPRAERWMPVGTSDCGRDGEPEHEPEPRAANFTCTFNVDEQESSSQHKIHLDRTSHIKLCTGGNQAATCARLRLLLIEPSGKEHRAELGDAVALLRSQGRIAPIAQGREELDERR